MKRDPPSSRGSGREDLKEGLVQVLRDRGLGHRRREVDCDGGKRTVTSRR
jgi:hypothetical protein